MISARYDTRRRALGLSVRDAADWHGTTERTINRWNSGAQDVEHRAWHELDRLERMMEAQVDGMLQVVTDHTATGPVPLFRYRTVEELEASPHACGLPLGAHAIMIGWLEDQLEAQGIEAEIVWAE